VWFRRDLRLADNPALTEACHQHTMVVPLFVWDPFLLRNAGAARKAFLAGCVRSLNSSLGGRLVVRHGPPVVEVLTAARDFGASTVYASEDFGPYGRRRDQQVGNALAQDRRTLVSVGSPYVVPPGQLRTKEGRPFQVFTAFARAWRRSQWEEPGPVPPLRGITPSPTTTVTLPPPISDTSSHLEPGEEAAHRRLDRFLLEAADSYLEDRDRADLDSTSRLSAYIRFGCLHPRQLLARLDALNPSHERLITELCWREFYADVLYHRPDAAWRAYRPEWEAMAVERGKIAEERLVAWTSGLTGYPIVDAGMRQLLAEGWMPNRVRMLTASFLVKDLHLDWRTGARWFMHNLVDGDLASNQLNWQWVAGSGNDAAPYFRVFNPVTQGKRFDPEGRYVRRWIPELQSVDDRWVHEPWKASPVAYMTPVVDHAKERLEALARFKKMIQRSQ
jgi:deoxyribodipyrimidine photo-lyase